MHYRYFGLFTNEAYNTGDNMNKKLVAILAVIIIVVIVAVAALSLSGGGEF